ncbi:Acyl-CoA-binding domain-containing protein 6 [Symbiodinium microadriaticum]|uniref:Acyl-CoA-binding domain-containing protein 6 n=1 Tax=Symbiodinium microadriaticum TaxID=2951 RepID=A0A1Q9DNH3_SYMMI|nr:Acyl-CoA-binding domain-containing protein 6 [Symbiodinium microadriaticum]
MLRTCIDLFNDNTSVDYDHWLEDPVLLKVFQEIFESQFSVLGVMCSLRPWRRKVPDPYLSSACAPLRLLIQGNMRQWQVYALEDMRLLSHNQLHEPLGESDWNFHLFGVRPNDVRADQVPSGLDGDPDGPRGSSSRARRSAAAAQPAAPLAPSERENDGRSAAPDSFEPPPEAGVERAEEGEQEESFDAVRPEQGPETLKPLFDFKKVFKRLQSGLIESDPVTAKRLLLGLHERFYHAPIGDFKNMLLRAGMSSDILPLAEEAVMSCSICRKYVRLPNRPQVKIGAGAGIFNHRIQADLFEYKKVWILLIIDEATRFKAATSVMSKDFAEITRKMVEHWFTVYGAPMQLVMDQETGMMSHEAGRELERFGIDRVPKGTTSGDAGKQHTGAGLVERHVGLLELTMQKLEAELDRQGIAIMPHELAKECSMAHNQSLNYNGATPSMAVFGVLPRPFYQEDTDNVVAMAGALQTDITPFERALRIRQTSLSMVQRAVAEDRVARANRSRPHQLRLSELVPGTTLVDYYREVNGDVGWRGPAELLKVSREEGTAILSYQGRPYLVSLRHIRPHQAGVFVTLSQVQEGDFNFLRTLVEKISPYKVMTVGWIVEHKDGCTMWRRSATSSLSYQETWGHITSVARALSSRAVGGALFGHGVRSFVPPKQSVGVLLYWKMHEAGTSFHEHTTDAVIVMKKITTNVIEETAFLCVYFYVFPDYEVKKDMRVLPSEGFDDADVPMNGDGGDPMSVGSSSPRTPTPPTTTSTDPDSPQSMDTEEESTRGEKRKGPDTRTVTLAPETKKSKLEELFALMSDRRVHTTAQHNLVNLYWVMHWTQAIPTEYPDIWQSYENSVYVAQWDLFMSRQTDHVVTNIKNTNHYLFQWSGKVNCELMACLNSGEIYKVDDETDNLSEADCYPIWDQVERADEDEIKQFVDTKSFEKMHRNSLTSDVIVIDAVWVRKWKRLPDGSRKVKSRLCARGCFDKQKDLLSTRSTTATRLSQRLLMSSAAVHDLDCESWDISGAFLKGLSFEKVRELLKAKGIRTPVRKVAVIVPANVWRHLGKFDPQFRIDVTKLGDYVLLCLKPVYGLSDAPLAWQLCLHAHFEGQKGHPSLMDENYFFWRDQKDRYIAGVTTHVDDCGAVGKKRWLDEQYSLLMAKFGKVTRQKLPFMHCGVLYSRISDGFRMSQDDFCSKLRPASIATGRKDTDQLTPEELTNFRSILGGLLWLTATRLDLVSDVCLLQSQVTRARIEHLKQANNVVKKAKAEIGQNLGIVFRRLRPPLRLACVHDSSAAGNVRNYAQEGVLVMLCEDGLGDFSRDEEHVMQDYQTKLLGGKAHILWAHGAKAKRISYSTSHAETLAAISGLEASTLVAVRMAELMYLPGRPKLQALIAAQEQGIPRLPVDDYTDCRDFFELASGDKSVSQDKNQRLYILAFREARMTGRIRWLVLCPTESMTADALTKAMISPALMTLLSSGQVEFFNAGEHRMTLRSLPRLANVTEQHFDMHDRDLIREVSTLAASSCLATTKTRGMPGKVLGSAGIGGMPSADAPGSERRCCELWSEASPREHAGLIWKAWLSGFLVLSDLKGMAQGEEDTPERLPAPEVTVSSRTLGGREVCFQIGAWEPVLSVKRRVASELRVPDFTIQLVQQGVTLKNETTLLKELLRDDVTDPSLDLVIVRIPGQLLDYRQLLRKFVQAANDSRFEEARQLLDEGAGFDAEGNLLLDFGSNVLHVAVRGRLNDLALHLISQGVDLESCNDMGRTPLVQACIKNTPEVITALLAAQADVNIKDASGRSAVYYAAMKENAAVVQQLIEAGADPAELEMLGCSVLRSHPCAQTGLCRMTLPRGLVDVEISRNHIVLLSFTWSCSRAKP